MTLELYWLQISSYNESRVVYDDRKEFRRFTTSIILVKMFLLWFLHPWAGVMWLMLEGIHRNKVRP